MSVRTRLVCACLSACLVLLSACGSGGVSSGSGIASNSGGIGGTGISRGSVTSFGSIVVNGVRFDTDGAEFFRDGVEFRQADFSVGEVVLVKGEFDSNGRTGTAKRVSYRPLVVGPVTGGLKNPNDSTVEILGQTVQVDSRTVFDGFTVLDELQVGDIVEVSGFFEADGSIRASLLRLSSGTSATELRLQGTVRNPDSGSMTFTIGSQTVDYSRATVLDVMPQDGAFVEVRSGAPLGASGVLHADQILSRTRGVPAQAGDEVEVEGFIDRFNSETGFVVAGVSVTITADTEFENGGRADLAVNERVGVEGIVNNAGVLVAEEIEFRPEGVIEITAPVKQVKCDDNSCQEGTITVLGIQVQTNQKTVFESDDDSVRLSLSDIEPGDVLEIGAYQNPPQPGAAVTAIHIEREETQNPTEVELTGAAQSKNKARQRFIILGVTVNTNNATFDDAGGSAAFYGVLEFGDIVEVQGTIINVNEIDADTVEFADD